VSDGVDALAGIRISESYVLSWSTEAESLIIDADLLLTPDHPAFEEPRPAEKQCYRPAWVEFPWCTAVRALNRNGPAAEVIRLLGDGKIRSLQAAGDGNWELAGEFGTVVIHSEAPMVRLRNNRA
jgi:hypothetical protein